MTHEEIFMLLGSQEFIQKLQTSARKRCVHHAKWASYHRESCNDSFVIEANKAHAYMNIDIALNELMKAEPSSKCVPEKVSH